MKLLLIALMAMFVAGCGTLVPEPLPFLCCSVGEEVSASARFMPDKEAARCFGVKLRPSGVQAMHITLQNNTDKSFTLFAHELAIPVARPQDIVEANKKSVLLETLSGLSFGSSLSLLGNIITDTRPVPASLLLSTVSMGATFGISAQKHNESLDRIFEEAGLIPSHVHPHGCLNFALFVPIGLQTIPDAIYLYDDASGERVRVNIQQEFMW